MSELKSFLVDGDDIPIIFPAGDTVPLRCGADGCVNSVTKPPRGRSPKYCEEHKVTPLSAKNATSGKSWARAVEIENLLTTYIRGLGHGIKLINAVDGEVIADNGPAVIHELVELAKTDRQIRKYLEWIATPGKYAPISLAVMALVLPIMANHSLLPSFLITLPTDREGE